MFEAMFATREDVDAALQAERPPDKTPDLPHCLASALRVPKTLKEAMRSQRSELWEDSVGREFRFDGAGNLDPGSQLHQCQMGLELKGRRVRMANEIMKLLARFVTQGDMQMASIDVGEWFTPTVSVPSVRLLAALAFEKNLDLCHFDNQQAFVQSELDDGYFPCVSRWIIAGYLASS